MAVLLFHSGVSSLTEQPPQKTITFGRAAALVVSRAFFRSRTGADPGSELGCGSEGLRLRTDFSHDLLPGVHAQARYFGQANHSLLMRSERLCCHLVEHLDLLIEQG